MSGTKAGATKLRATMIKKYGSEEAWREHMRNNGSKGGRNGNKKLNPNYQGGFAHPDANPKAAGARGGRISRRTKKV